MKVYVIGELNVDLIVTGTDVTPEWNREKLVDGLRLALGSSSAITACALAGLGADVEFVSIVGDDEFGRFCADQLRAKGVGTGNLAVDPALQTGVTLSLSTPSDKGLLTYMGSIASVTPALLPDMDALRQADHVHFGSYYLQEGMQPHWLTLFGELRRAGVTTSFDTGWDIRGVWQRERIAALMAETDFFLPGEDELAAIFGGPGLGLEELTDRLPARRGLVAVKRGAAGAALVLPDGGRLTAKAYAITPVDTTGAGDSFNAGFIYGYYRGKRGAELLAFAGACGALSTQAVGGAGHQASEAEAEAFARTTPLRE